jgi:hypothetical protein
MTESEKIDQDPGGSAELTPLPGGKQRLYAKARALSEKELSRPESAQFLLGEIERLNQEVSDLGVYRERFHDADKEREVLRHKLSESQSGNTLFDICLAIGAAIIGLAPGVWKSQPYGWIFGTFGVILLLASVVHKVRNREY